MTKTSLVKPPIRGDGHVVLVLGNYRHALTTARQLSAHGFKVILGAEKGTNCCETCRHVHQVWQCPPFVPGSAEFLAALRALLRRLPKPVTIMPVGEWPLDTIASFEAELAPLARLATPSAQVLSVIHDKHRSLVFARDAGLDVPPFATASDLRELAARVAEVGCPVVMRTVVSGTRIGKQKAITVDDPARLAQALPVWPDGVEALLVQRRFVGARTNVYFAAQDGRILAEQHSLSLRTDRLDGTGQTIEGVTIPPIPAVSRELTLMVRALRYTGVGNAQFLYDEETGKACFLEINGRFGASYAFTERVGMGLTLLALDLAWNDPRDVPDHSRRYDSGTRFVWTLGDLDGLKFAITQGGLPAGQALRWAWRALVAALRADVHVTWSLTDPLPTLVMYGRWLASTIAKPLGLAGRRAVAGGRARREQEIAR